jgi:pectinesterase
MGKNVVRFLVLFFCFGLATDCTGAVNFGMNVKAAEKLSLVVDINSSNPNGTTTFNSITSAINYLSNHKPVSEAERVTINIKAGVYKEKIDMNIPYVTFQGDLKGETKLTFNVSNKTVNPEDPNGGTYSSGNCAALLVKAKDFKANNMTFENSYLKDNGVDTQAACVQVSGDCAAFIDCKFYSGQDVLNVNYNRSYFKNCYIEGGVDSVWGLNSSVGFDNCTFNQIKNGAAYTAGGGNKCYFLFNNCKFTAIPNNQIINAVTAAGGKSIVYSKITSVLFGRTWYPGEHVCIKNSTVTAPISPKAWTNMKGDTIDPSCELFEYKNVDEQGKLLDTTQRNFAKQLSDADASKYNMYDWLKGTDNWNPTK